MKQLITAVFIGQDGSLGYESYRQYALYIEPSGAGIRITRVADSNGTCIYSNIIAFLENWNTIQTKNG